MAIGAGVTDPKSKYERNRENINKSLAIFAWSMFVIAELGLAIVCGNDLYYDSFIGNQPNSIQATIVAVYSYNVSSGKSSSKHFAIAYEFAVQGKTFRRTNWFGTDERGTEVSEHYFRSLENGKTIEVVYSDADPRINRPTFESTNLWHIVIELALAVGLGFLVFMTTGFEKMNHYLKSRLEKFLRDAFGR